MDERDLFKRMDVINEETKRLGEENPTGPDETDPHVHKLIEEGVEIVKQLDPIMREKFRDDPAAGSTRHGERCAGCQGCVLNA